MFVLTILALALLPLLVQAVRVSTDNTTRATAVQIVNQQMELAQAAGPSCSEVTSLPSVIDRTDSRGVPIRVVTSFGSCPATVGTVGVSAVATRLDSGAELARADTLVFVVP